MEERSFKSKGLRVLTNHKSMNHYWPSSISSSHKILIGSTTALFLVSSVAAWKFHKLPSPSSIAHRRHNSSLSNNMPFSSTSKASADLLTPAEQKTRKIWNSFANGYSKQPIPDPAAYQTKLDMTTPLLTPTSRVLEIGCGTGGTALYHAPKVQQITAIDVSSRMIEIARVKAQEAQVTNVDFQCAGIDSFLDNHLAKQTNEPLDVVLALSILHLLPNKNDVLAKIHASLRPGGYLVSSTTCMGDFARVVAAMIKPFTWMGFMPTLNVFTKVELRQSMEDAGFVIEEEFHPGKDKAVFLIARKKMK